MLDVWQGGRLRPGEVFEVVGVAGESELFDSDVTLRWEVSNVDFTLSWEVLAEVVVTLR